MSTVLRVKRRLEDNPQDALVLMCKRFKTDAEEVSPSLFVFRGTVDSKEAINVKTIVPKRDIKLEGKHDVNEIIKKIRKERKDKSTESRYEVVNCSRGLQEGQNETDDNYNLVDLQQQRLDEERDVKYAYDLYTAAKQDFDISMLDSLVSIENYETNLIFGSYRDNGRQTPSDGEADDDDDSNDENNWRNEYPDSDPSTIDDEDMIRAVEKIGIDSDLSSDTGEDQIYDEPPDLFNEDVKRYGEAYAKYKAKVLSDNPDLSSDSIGEQPVSKGLIHYSKVKDLDEEAVDSYKNDSDDGFYYGEEEDTEQFKEQYAEDSDSDVYSPD